MNKFKTLPNNYNDEKEMKKLEKISAFIKTRLDENKNVVFSHYETPDGHRLNQAETKHLLKTGNFKRMVKKDVQ